MSSVNALVCGSARPWLRNGVGSACHCRSGADSEGRVRLNPPDSVMVEVNGPECRSCQRNRFLVLDFSHRAGTFGVRHMAGTTGWSDRFAPPPGPATITKVAGS